MASISRLGIRIEEVVSPLNAVGVPFALIGGLALAAPQTIRVSLGVHALADADLMDDAFRRLGYLPIHRSADAVSYYREDERIDLVCAVWPTTRHLRLTAPECPTSFGATRVVEVEAPTISFGEPYAVLDDLMSVIEGFCPVWPARTSFTRGPYLL